MNGHRARRLAVTLLVCGAAAVALFVGWRMGSANRNGVRIDHLLGSPSAGTFLNYRLPQQASEEIRAMGTNAIPCLLRNLDKSSGRPRLYGLIVKPWVPRWIISRFVDDRQKRHDRARAVADAFGALGPAAADAVPELLRRVGQPPTANTAAFCLMAIGPPPRAAISTLWAYLQSTNTEVRAAAARALICIDPDAAMRAGLR